MLQHVIKKRPGNADRPFVVESLEDRCLLAFPGPIQFGGNVNAPTLVITNLVDDTNNDCVINLGEQTAAGANYDFQVDITVNGIFVTESNFVQNTVFIRDSTNPLTIYGSTLLSSTGLDFDRNGTGVPGGGTGTTVTTISISVPVASFMPDADYRLELFASNAVQPLTAGPSAEFIITVDTMGPVVTDVVDVAPDPRGTAVSTVDVVFDNNDVNLTSFTAADISLTRDGNPVALAVTTAFVSGNTYRISGLDTETTPDGDYVLTVNGAGIQDTAGNSGSGSPSDTWTKDTQPPSVPGMPMLDTADDTGRFNNDAITSANTNLTFQGTVASADTVRVDVEIRRQSDNFLVATAMDNAPSVGGGYTVDFAGPIAEDTYVVTAVGVDSANNASTASLALTLVIDRTAPATPTNLDLTNDTAGPQIVGADDITMNSSPAFAFNGADVDARVTLDRDGTLINFDPLMGMALATATDTTIPLMGGDPVDTDLTFMYRVRQEDLAGNQSAFSPALEVVVDSIAPVVMVAVTPADQLAGQPNASNSTNPGIDVTVTEQQFQSKDNLVRYELLDQTNAVLDTVDVTFANLMMMPPPAMGHAETTLTRTLNPGTLAVGLHMFNIRVTDAAGNVVVTPFTLGVLTAGQNTPATPGTPVFTRAWDVQSTGIPLPDFAGGPAGMPPGNDASIQPWQTAFDPSTQTTWITLENANGIAQFDPATGMFFFYDINAMGLTTRAGMAAEPVSNPHGINFDLESHITPRVWWAMRNAETNRVQGVNSAGSFAYLDVATGRVFHYNVSAAGFNVSDMHAVSVDPTGDMWFSSREAGKIYQLDVDHLPDGTPNASINSSTGTLIERTIPFAGFSTHGVEAVYDDSTGQVFVYMTSVRGNGDLVLLAPGTNGAPDRWFKWNLNSASLATPIANFGGLFTAIDDNETPNNPYDDIVYWVDPGQNGPGSGLGAIRRIDPSAVLRAAASGGAAPATSPHTTYSVPDPRDAAELTRINFSFVDREGNLFFIDRDNGVGRLDPDAFGFTVDTQPLPVEEMTSSNAVAMGITPQIVDNVTPQIFNLTQSTPMGFATTGVSPDVSTINGLDAYDVTFNNSSAANNDAGFRGKLNAGNVLYASYIIRANNDNSSQGILGQSIFAESSRRQMTVVETDAGGRLAFQVQRNGHIILTARKDGELIDRQVDLTAAIGGPVMDGDVSAVRDASGMVHVIGRGSNNDLVAYRLDLATGAWTASSLGASPTGVLVGEPTAFLDGGQAAALVTTDTGRVVVYTANGAATEISTADNQAFSSVAALEDTGTVFVYATNQTGALVRFRYPSGAPAASAPVNVNIGAAQIFQNVSAVALGGAHHVFATNGSSQLFQMQINDPSAAMPVAIVTNVSQTVQATATGYADYQQAFAGRVYTEVDVVVEADGTIQVYGTNARDLIQFTRSANGTWSAANLTNDALVGGGSLESNKVFGAPAAYVLPNGDRHVMQINADGEVIEYYYWEFDQRFHTQNISLGQLARFGGLSSLSDLGMSAGALHVAATSTAASSDAGLTREQLQPIVTAAIARYESLGLPARLLSTLRAADYAVADLHGTLLGIADVNGVTIDVNGAGFGWFIDPTPSQDEEFSANDQGVLASDNLDGRVDLLTVVMHEMAHVLGAPHGSDQSEPVLLNDKLELDLRLTPDAQLIDEILRQMA